MIRVAAAICFFLSASAFAVDVRTAETQALLKWLSRPDPVPALGAQWNGGTKSFGWLEQAAILNREPLIYGIEYHDYGPIERRLDARNDAKQLIERKFGEGGLVTLVDHMPNFVTGGNSWDRAGDTLTEILPGGRAHADYVDYLKRMATFLEQLQVDGVTVPVLFRPFHEMNGEWFWWGDRRDGARYIQLWRFTWDYLTNVRGLKNLVWVWSPNIATGWSEAEFRRYWPGRPYVDVVALDGYDNREKVDFMEAGFISSFAAVARIAKADGLPLAFSEMGFQHAGQNAPGFWTEHFLPRLLKEIGPLSYVLIWNNAYGPKAGSPAAESFRDLALRKTWLLQGDAAPAAIYGKGFRERRGR